jgi:ABC-type branched-subunit amino acid transport system substrate-binding protein
MSTHHDRNVAGGVEVSRTRRRILQGAGVGALALGFPYIVRAADPIKVGILQPLSGGLETLGQQGVQGTQMAIEEANEAGGVLGRKFELTIADDKTDPKTAVERTRELIQRDKVAAIFGPVTSANRDAIQPTIDRLKTPLFYATDYEGGVCSRYMVCYSALPEHWVDPFLPFVQQNYGDSFYLVGSDYVWPQKMNAAIRRVVERGGGKVVGEEYTPWGVKDLTSTLRKIEQSGAKVLVLTVVGADAITFVKQFTAAGLKSKCRIAWMGYSENYIGGLSREESEGVVTVANFISTLDKPEAKAFSAKVRKRFGDNAVVSNTVDAHYMLTRFFIESIKRAKSAEPEKFLDHLAGYRLQSGNGMVMMRKEDRHADVNVVFAETRNQQMVLLKDVGAVKAPSQCKA